MQESKRILHVAKPGTSVFLPIAVAPGQNVQSVLAEIGAGGAALRPLCLLPRFVSRRCWWESALAVRARRGKPEV